MKTIPKKLNKELADAAKDMGVSKEEALRDALLLYRKRSTASPLRDELLLWDRASEEDFTRFEKKI